MLSNEAPASFRIFSNFWKMRRVWATISPLPTTSRFSFTAVVPEMNSSRSGSDGRRKRHPIRPAWRGNSFVDRHRRKFSVRRRWCPQLKALNLPGFGFWQAIDNLDLARVGVVAHKAAGSILDLAHEIRRPCLPGLQGDICRDNLTLQRVGLAYHAGFSDSRVMEDGALNLERSNAIPGALDHIIRAAFEPVISSFVPPREVAGDDPPVSEEMGRAVRIVPVA